MTKEDIKSLVIVFLESNTGDENLWVNLKSVYLLLVPQIYKSFEDQIEAENLLINSLNDMCVDGHIRIDKKKDNTVIVALEKNIQDILNGLKKSALDEMEDELQKCVKEENYEKAAEYRDMINEYKSKSESE